MLWPTLTAAVILLLIFYAIDKWFYSKPGEAFPPASDPTPDAPIRITGKLNFVLLAAVLGCVLLSGLWNPGLEFRIYGTTLELQNVLRDIALLLIAWISWRYTRPSVRHANHFDWAPIVEIAKLFAGIFLTIIPAVAMLRAGHEGVMAPVLAIMSDLNGRPNDVLYFWMAGALSSFLDNAPTYLIFFNLAGGDAADLMGPLATTLTAISAGAVFMGANTYIGNAPNFMVKSIAQSRGVAMPTFLGYMAWSMLVLLPIFALLTLVFFR
jgi:Na+/H+ antiporter NhaD/arsenite permease-like protein